MSAPVVTGAIALWLQADPTLTTSDCMDIFAKTCTHYDSSLSYPNNLYGYGQIDVMADYKRYYVERLWVSMLLSVRKNHQIIVFSS